MGRERWAENGKRPGEPEHERRAMRYRASENRTVNERQKPNHLLGKSRKDVVQAELVKSRNR